MGEKSIPREILLKNPPKWYRTCSWFCVSQTFAGSLISCTENFTQEKLKHIYLASVVSQGACYSALNRSTFIWVPTEISYSSINLGHILSICQEISGSFAPFSGITISQKIKQKISQIRNFWVFSALKNGCFGRFELELLCKCAKMMITNWWFTWILMNNNVSDILFAWFRESKKLI